jgi:adenosylmethionine---8-amino-7-oxononanoate aminotransferase
MAGIELVADKASKRSFETTRRIGARLCQGMRSQGVMLRPLGDVIVIMPPLAISKAELEELLGVVGEAIRKELPKLVCET